LFWTCFYCTSKSGGEARAVTFLGGEITKTLAHQDVGQAPGEHIIYDRETDKGLIPNCSKNVTVKNH